MATVDTIYDAVVVGAGVEGSATAYQLAKRGRNVLVLEQFKLGHNRGSSHSLSRITRKAYGSRDFFTEMMKDSYRLMDELQTEYGEQLFENTGCMILGKKGEDFLESTQTSLVRHHVSHERFAHGEAKRRFPNMVFPETFEYIIDKSGGVLRADRVLQAFQKGCVKHGGTIHDEEEMLDISQGDIITVKTTKGEYRTRSLVLAMGPWASKWLPRMGVNIPLEPLKVLVCYWKEKNPGEFDYRKFPTFIDVTTLPTGNKSQDIYGLPSYERPGYVKICLHGGQAIDPDSTEDLNMDWITRAVSQYVKEHFPSLEDTPSFVESCFYTCSPDAKYYLDTHPEWKNVVIGTGFSGQGFKMAPVVGCILADLAVGKTPDFEMTHFKLNRFSKSKI